jgi:hypothetical protein
MRNILVELDCHVGLQPPRNDDFMTSILNHLSHFMAQDDEKPKRLCEAFRLKQSKGFKAILTILPKNLKRSDAYFQLKSL